MNNVKQSISVVIITVMTTLCSFGQTHWIGPMAASTLSSSVGPDVAGYGTPTRYAYGAQYSYRSASAAEITFTMLRRAENGGYISEYVKPSGGVIGKVNVVDAPGGAPVVITTLTSASIEAGVALRLPILQLDTLGTKILFQFGISADRLLSLSQVADFSRVPESDRIGVPSQTTVNFDGQTGFGGQFGLALSANAGPGRLLLEVAFNVRQPVTIAFPQGTAGASSEQNIGWLTGRGIRAGVSYQVQL